MANKTDERAVRAQAAEWALRRSDGELTTDESRLFESWLAARPEHVAAYERAAAILGDSRAILREDADFARRNFEPHSSGPGVKTVMTSVVLIGLCLAYALDMPLRMTADEITASNDIRIVTLADGSRVRMNGNSALAEHFTSDRRLVRLLRGEAYFEVSKDAARPFVVEAGAGEAKALGTAFNVNLLGGSAEVTVAESRVAVSGEAVHDEVVLQPGERIAYDGDGRLGEVLRVPEGLEAPWLHDRLVFEERSLGSVVEEIFRRLPGRPVIVNPATAGRLVTGSFDLSNPEQALQDFALAFDIRIVRGGSFVTLIY